MRVVEVESAQGRDAVRAEGEAIGLPPSGLTLTVDRRKTFNDLVVQINNVIQSVVTAAAANSDYKFKIGFSNWDVWPSQGVAGPAQGWLNSGVLP